MEKVKVFDWIIDNLTWLIPCFFSALFSVISIIQTRKLGRMQREESERNNKFLDIQTALQREADAKSEMFMRTQEALQRTQVSVELLNQRLKIYDGFSNLYRSALGANSTDDEVITKFWMETESIECFFGEEMKGYRDKVQKAFLHLQLVRKLQQGESAKTDHATQMKLIDQENEDESELLSLMAQQSQIFKPFFDFAAVRQQSVTPEYHEK
jgi:hypothetical protein